MFKKLLSNLPYNPSLIGQVSFYAKRMHADEQIRRFGLFFVALALFVQMFAAISKPESTLALSQNDIIPGGFSTHAQANTHCSANNYEFRVILARYGVTCANLAGAVPQNIRSTDHNKKLLSLGRLPYGKAGERPQVIDGKTYYQRYLWAWDSGPYSTYKALVGKTDSGAPFMVLYNCGNITVIESPAPAPAPAPQPAPEPTPPPQSFVPGDAICTSLRATPLNERTYRFKATTAGTDYVVKSYVFSFGDGSTKTISTSLLNASTEHTYRATKTYTAKVTVNVNVQGTSGVVAKSLQCQTTVATNTPDVCPDVIGNQTSRTECDVCPNIPGTQSNEAECKPCDNSQDTDDVTACLILSKTARNNTQKIDNADGTVAYGNDSITYSLKVKNTGKVTVKDFVVEENIADVLDYAEVTDFNGGKIGEDNIVRWPATDISPDETITRRLTIKIKDPIPQTPIATSNPGTFDLTMTNVYGNTVNITLPPSITKTTEQVIRQLPSTGPGESVAVASLFTIFVSYFFARSRLFAKELDIVRTDYATTGGY